MRFLPVSNNVELDHSYADAPCYLEISTFLIAGTDTTRYLYVSISVKTSSHRSSSMYSLAVSFTLSALCKDPAIQSTLRNEIRSSSLPVDPSMEDLNTLPYLDAVVRETLRVYPPLPGTARVAAKDDIIPLAKPWVDVNGKSHSGLRWVIAVIVRRQELNSAGRVVGWKRVR